MCARKSTFEAWWFCMKCGQEASDEHNFKQRRKGPPHEYYVTEYDPRGVMTLCYNCGNLHNRYKNEGTLEKFGKLLDPWTHAQQLGKKRRS